VNRHHVLSLPTVALLAAALLALPVVGGPAHADSDRGRPGTYRLTGDTGGSKLEGIGADQRRGVFYVSEVTGDEIHRGTARSAQTSEWLPEGAEGRVTARGITVDGSGRVHVAGGPNGLGTGRPDLWIYSPRWGAARRGARSRPRCLPQRRDHRRRRGAFFTNSNDPQVFRVADDVRGWTASLWADARGSVERVPGFNLGGIVLTADRSALVVAQGTTGQLWRFDSADGSVSPADSTGADLVNADGLVRQGATLTVVRNFSRMLATLRLSADGRTATVLLQQATDPSRVLTTAATPDGRILFVDSRFDEPVVNPPYEVVTDPMVR
jgi:hypothetical protein